MFAFHRLPKNIIRVNRQDLSIDPRHTARIQPKCIDIIPSFTASDSDHRDPWGGH